MIMTGIEKKHKYDMEFKKVILVFVRYSLKTSELWFIAEYRLKMPHTEKNSWTPGLICTKICIRELGRTTGMSLAWFWDSKMSEFIGENS